MDLGIIDRKAKDNSNHFGWPEDGDNKKSNVTVFKSFYVLFKMDYFFLYSVSLLQFFLPLFFEDPLHLH